MPACKQFKKNCRKFNPLTAKFFFRSIVFVNVFLVFGSNLSFGLLPRIQKSLRHDTKPKSFISIARCSDTGLQIGNMPEDGRLPKISQAMLQLSPAI